MPSALLVSSVNDLKDAHIMHDVAQCVQPQHTLLFRYRAPRNTCLCPNDRNYCRFVFEGKKRSLFEDATGSSRRSNWVSQSVYWESFSLDSWKVLEELTMRVCVHTD